MGFIHRAPGGPLSLAVFDLSAARVAGLGLPPDWRRTTFHDPAELVDDLETNTVVVLVSASELDSLLRHRNSHLLGALRCPVLAIADKIANPPFRRPLPDYVVANPSIVPECASFALTTGVARYFTHLLLSVPVEAPHSLLRHALWALANSHTERPTLSGPIRTVGELSQYVGTSESYLRALSRESGLRLKRVLSWHTLLFGLRHYVRGRTLWETVARLSGFSSASSWSHFCRRLTSLPPSELVGRTWSTLVAMALIDIAG